MKETPKLEDLPQAPEGAEFELRAVDAIFDPHPFMVGPKHIELARGGKLDPNSWRCYHSGCKLSYDEHKSTTVLVIAVPQNKDLKAITGLEAWLVEVNPKMEELGIEGYVFPTK